MKSKEVEIIFLVWQELNSSITPLREVSHYYFDGQGKYIRPMIVLLAAGACNLHASDTRLVLLSGTCIWELEAVNCVVLWFKFVPEALNVLLVAQEGTFIAGVSLKAGHWANWPAARMIFLLPGLTIEERFSYREVKFKKFYLAVTTIFPPETPVSGEGTLTTGIICTNGIRNRLSIHAFDQYPWSSSWLVLDRHPD